MQNDRDTAVAATFSERCHAARGHLLKTMEALGMREKDGWRIAESVRQVRGGSELVLRPLHLYLNAPPDMECVVWIADGGNDIDMSCQP